VTDIGRRHAARKEDTMPKHVMRSSTRRRRIAAEVGLSVVAALLPASAQERGRADAEATLGRSARGGGSAHRF
jgi:hypothetical protein